MKRCLAYVSNVEPEITIVLSPIITTPRQQDRATRFIGINVFPCGVIVLLIHLKATVPTVGDAIEALTDFCDELLETLKQMTAISAELEARDHVQVEDIRQVGRYIAVIALPSVTDSGYRLSACETLITWVILTLDKNAP